MGATDDDTAILLLVDASAQVTVEPVEVVVQLELSGPDTVTVRETYTVRVDTDMPVPEGTTLEVTLSDGIGVAPEFVMLTGGQSIFQSFMAPDNAGPVVITATVMARTSSGSLQVAVAEQVTLTVMVEAVQISLQLQLEAVPAEVTARTSFEVMVVAEPAVPMGTTVTVTVSFDGTDGSSVVSSPVVSSPVALSAGMTSAAVMLTAPDRLVEALVLTASGDVEDAASDMQQVTAAPATATVMIVPQRVQLTLEVPPRRVTFDSPVAVTVGVSPPLLADTRLTVEVTFGAASEEVTLSDMTSSQLVPFTALEAGLLAVNAQMVAVEPAGLVVATSASASVEVLPEGTVELTLAVPDENVTVGATFTVTVGVATDTPVPVGTTLTATISFPEGDDAEMGTAEVELTMMASSAMADIRAPFAAGDFTVEVNGMTSEAIPEVRPASAQVSVEAVALALELSGPDEVTVNQPYQVTVSTQPEVPAGTTLTVTVSDGPDMREVLLTAAIPSTEVSFTAPARAGDVEITATVEDDEDVQTAEGSLEVAVSDAAPLAVTVAAEQVQLALRLEAPAQVEVGSTFRVTVATNEPVPEGATVAVTVVFDGADSEPVMLSAERTTAAVTLTAPGTTTGTFTVAATGTATVADDSVLQVTVMDASTEVDVVAQQLTLTLTVMPDPVNVGGQLVVTVGLSPALLVAATLMVEVTFGTTSTQVTLSNTEPSQVVTFIPLEAGMLEVRAQMVGNAEPLGLVVVEATTTQVRVREAGTIGLTLVVPEEPVEAGSTFPVMVGTDLPMLLATTATVQVMVTLAGGSTQIRTLSAGSETATVMFMAPGSPTGTYTVNAIGMGTTPVMTVEAANTSVTVVPAAIAVTLRAPRVVDVGDTFSVEVGTEPALPAGTMVDLIVRTVQIDGAFSASRTATLSATASTASVEFTAPESGTLALTAEVVGITQSSPVVAVSAPSTEVLVREQATIDLSLSVLDSQPVEAGSIFFVSLEVMETDMMLLPSGAEVRLTVTFAGIMTSLPAIEIPAEEMGERSTLFSIDYTVGLTAPDTPGTYKVAATGTSMVSNDSNELLQLTLTPASTEVVVVAAMTELTLTAPRVVNGGSTFMATVGVGPNDELPAGTEVDLIVRIDGASSASRTVTLSGMTPSDSVDFMAPPSGRLELTAEVSTVRGTIETVIANPATVTVQVTELVTLGLSLVVLDEETGRPVMEQPAEVEAGSIFSVMVETDMPVPAEATVQLMVTFDGSTEPVTLLAGATKTTVMFTAPGTTDTSTVNASGGATVTNADALRVMVNPTSTEVVVVPVPITLTLVPSSRVVVDAGAPLSVEVGTDRPLTDFTEVDVLVQLGSTTDTVRLTEMMPTASLAFTAPPSGMLDLTAEVTDIQQGDTVVTVSDAATVTVQVTELITLGLTLNAPEQANAGSPFRVTVQTDRPVPAESTVQLMVTFDGSTQTPMLPAGATMTTVMFTAPGTTTGPPLSWMPPARQLWTKRMSCR